MVIQSNGFAFMKRALGVGFTAFLLISSGDAAIAACEGRSILFEDSFDTLQPSWGEVSNSFKIEDKRLVIEPEPDESIWRINQANLYDDIDMCVAMTTITGIEPDNTQAGLLFWYVDENNFYVLEQAPNGKASVWRRQRGRWLEQIKWQTVKGAHSGDASINELRVVTRGDRVKVFINETELGEFTGVAPNDGQLIGLFATSPEIGSARYAFDNLKITRP